jgi:hypothetical protein
MRVEDGTTGGVVERSFEVSLEILDQRPVAPNIQSLCPVAYGEDRLGEIERILQQELVNRRTAGIGPATVWNRIFAISLWVNIIATTREQDSLDSTEQPGYAVLTLVEGNYDWGRPGGVEGGKIRRQGALIVGWIAAGGFGNGDVD